MVLCNAMESNTEYKLCGLKRIIILGVISSINKSCTIRVFTQLTYLPEVGDCFFYRTNAPKYNRQTNQPNAVLSALLRSHTTHTHSPGLIDKTIISVDYGYCMVSITSTLAKVVIKMRYLQPFYIRVVPMFLFSYLFVSSFFFFFFVGLAPDRPNYVPIVYSHISQHTCHRLTRWPPLMVVYRLCSMRCPYIHTVYIKLPLGSTIAASIFFFCIYLPPGGWAATAF